MTHLDSFGVRRSWFVAACCSHLRTRPASLSADLGARQARTVSAQQPVDGAKVYADNCASCHDQPTGRTPPKDALKERTADAIHLSLTSGTMAIQGLTLSVAEKKAVAEYLSGKPLGAAGAEGAGRLRRASRRRSATWRGSRSGTAGAPTRTTPAISRSRG